MFNFKPSELPVGTKISDKVVGFWTKDSDNVWFMDDPHCVDCSEMVLQGDPTPAENEMMNNVWKYHDTPADEFFTDFKIISFPFEIVVLLAEGRSNLDGAPVTTEAVIRNAIEDFNRPIYSADNPMKDDEL